jgi:hypothetical protein
VPTPHGPETRLDLLEHDYVQTLAIVRKNYHQRNHVTYDRSVCEVVERPQKSGNERSDVRKRQIVIPDFRRDKPQKPPKTAEIEAGISRRVRKPGHDRRAEVDELVVLQEIPNQADDVQSGGRKRSEQYETEALETVGPNAGRRRQQKPANGQKDVRIVKEGWLSCLRNHRIKRLAAQGSLRDCRVDLGGLFENRTIHFE